MFVDDCRDLGFGEPTDILFTFMLEDGTGLAVYEAGTIDTRPLEHAGIAGEVTIAVAIAVCTGIWSCDLPVVAATQHQEEDQTEPKRYWEVVSRHGFNLLIW